MRTLQGTLLPSICCSLCCPDSTITLNSCGCSSIPGLQGSRHGFCDSSSTSHMNMVAVNWSDMACSRLKVAWAWKAAAQYHGLNDNTDEHCLH